MYIPDRFVQHLYSSLDSIKDAIFVHNDHYEYDYLESLPLERSMNLVETYHTNFEIIVKGYLMKKTLNSYWYPRYFVLTPTRLLYFVDDKLKEFKGCFALCSLVEHDLSVTSSFPVMHIEVAVYDHQYNLNSRRVLLQLQITDHTLYNFWYYKLTNIINILHLKSSTHYPHIYSNLLSYNHTKFFHDNFWNKLSISTNYLYTYSHHLDILFFRSCTTCSTLYRFFMGSHYDHVAILLKNYLNVSYVFEVRPYRGVCIVYLKQLLEHAAYLYEEIGYRKLLSKTSFSYQLDSLYQYLNSLLGRKYYLSVTKLLINNTENIIEPYNNIYNISNKYKTYFCSELVADIYIKFNVLHNSMSNKYWPKDFEGNYLELQDGYYLTPIMDVQFDDYYL